MSSEQIDIEIAGYFSYLGLFSGKAGPFLGFLSSNPSLITSY